MSEGLSSALVAVATWLTPSPIYASGLLVNYGGQQTVEDQAWFHDYDLAPYPRRCGLAVMSPTDLGKIVWVRVAGAEWFGPCLAVDVSARHHFYDNVYLRGEVAEVPRWLAEWFGFENGAPGYIYVAACPPPTEDWTPARRYRPRLRYDRGQDSQPNFWPYPRQELPVRCIEPMWQ